MISEKFLELCNEIGESCKHTDNVMCPSDVGLVDFCDLNCHKCFNRALTEHDAKIRAEVIDELVNKLKEVSYPLSNLNYNAKGEAVDMDDVFEIAKQLKEGKE